jgi:serine/threonine-protein kinase
MASVYLARFTHDPSGKIVVIKRIHDHLADKAAFRDMLVDEARLCARLCHPNVVQVIELGSVDGSLFIAMEHVESESLKSLVKRVRLSFVQAIRIIAGAAAGLHHAHELLDAEGRPLEVVHRDVSPQNILISYEGEVKVVDFGIAKARDNLQQTDRGVVKGKLAYMAPEQARAGRVDPRTDVFSLGVVLYEITTNRRLFRGASPADSVEKVLRMAIPRPTRLLDDYPTRLEEIVMTALRRDPRRRFQSAGEMEDALTDLLQDLPTRTSARDLGRVMKAIFADRMALKRETLARSEQHGAIVDTTRISGSSPSMGSLEGTIDEAAIEDARQQIADRRRLRLLLCLAVVFGVLAALLLVLAIRYIPSL